MIIAIFRRKRGLHDLIIQVHDASLKKLTEKFIKNLTDDSWILTAGNAQYSSFGDRFNSLAVMILSIHSYTKEKASHLHLPNPP